MSIVSPSFILYFRSLIVLILNSFFIYIHNKSLLTPEQQQQKPQINEQIHPSHSLIPSNPLNLALKLDVPNDTTFKLLIKTIFYATLSVLLYTIPLKTLPLSITHVLYLTSPIFAILIDVFINKTQVLKPYFYPILLTFLGLFLLLFPSKYYANTQPLPQSNPPSLFVFSLPLFSAFFSHLAINNFTKLNQKLHPLTTIQYLMIGMLIASGIYFNFDHATGTLNEKTIKQQKYQFQSVFSPWFIISIILMSVLLYLTEYMKLKSIISPLGYKNILIQCIGMVLLMLFDIVVFKSYIKWYQYIGIVLTSSCLTINNQNDKTQKQYGKMSETQSVSISF